MKKTLLIVSSFLLLTGLTFAQQGDGGIPAGAKLDNTYKNVDTKVFSEPDVNALRAEDAINDPLKNSPWRFGFNNETNLNFDNSGTWTEMANGDRIWRLKLVCQNALTVNLTLKDVILPEGNELYVYNVDKSFILGKFTNYHLYEGQLGTELIPGNTAVVEYYVPYSNLNLARSLEIQRVTHGYRTASEFANKAFGSSGSCNMNVNCPQGSAWADQKRGALMLVSGGNGFCSGSMINNTANDGKPYVLTANHCYSNPSSWVFRFNWEASGCTNPGSSPSFVSLSGATLRSRRTPSDFCLVEITGGLQGGTVPASFNTYFSGWNNQDVNPSSSVSIHHPSGDIKKISFDDNAASAVQAMGSSEPNSSWQVQWDQNTTTEGGSSGSPLFDQNQRIIGQLWGGGASCSNLTAPDYYGRVYNSWEPTGSNSTNQLKYWLDPQSSGVGVLDGYDPNAVTLPDNAGIQVVISPLGMYCDGNVNPEVTLKNFGTNALTSVTINYNIDGGANNTFAWTGNLAPNATTNVTLPSLTTTTGAHTFNASTSNPNGTTDTNPGDDSASSSFNSTIGGEQVHVEIITDCWGSETTWEIKDGATVLFSGGPYTDVSGGEQISEYVCLAAGCYDFVIYDSYGDGLYGSQYGSCSVDGDYTITQVSNSATLATLQAVNSDFGTEETNNFCVTSNIGLEEGMLSDFAVYPNPNNGNMTISMLNKSFDAYTVNVLDISGRVIFSDQFEGSTATIQLTNASTGTYMVQISTEVGAINKRIVIK